MKIPVALINMLEGIPGFDESSFTAIHASGEQVTSIRLNPLKVAGPLQLQIKGEVDDLPLLPVPWNNFGFYLPERPSFTTDPSFHAGAYYVQEASSMFLQQVLQQVTNTLVPLKVLDLCAAPGGKSTLIQSVITPDSLLVSNEVIKPRVKILAENIAKWGAANVIVTNNDPKDFQRLPGYFDVMVVDAPCSGSGLFRKDPNAINEWSEQNVTLCCQRQQRILADALPALKEGGVLIYATCSYSPAENEDITDWLVNEMGLENCRIAIDPGWNIVETQSESTKSYGYRFYPYLLKGEGFFIAAFRKGGTAEKAFAGRKSTAASEKWTARDGFTLNKWLTTPENYFFTRQHEDVLAIPVHLQYELSFLQSKLYLKQAGIKMGTLVRDEMIPAHELALSGIVTGDVKQIEVDRTNALQYLRRQPFEQNSQITGWALITYRSLALGWVKVLSNRVNNYYPKEWRILNK